MQGILFHGQHTTVCAGSAMRTGGGPGPYVCGMVQHAGWEGGEAVAVGTATSKQGRCLEDMHTVLMEGTRREWLRDRANAKPTAPRRVEGGGGVGGGRGFDKEVRAGGTGVRRGAELSCSTGWEGGEGGWTELPGFGFEGIGGG